MHFVPAFFVGDPANLPNYWVRDRIFSVRFSAYPGREKKLLIKQWDGGWAHGNYDVNTDIDDALIADNGGYTFMAAVSPWFFTVCARRVLRRFAAHANYSTTTTRTGCTTRATSSSLGAGRRSSRSATHSTSLRSSRGTISVRANPRVRSLPASLTYV
jgi:hypothetical protein